MSTATVVSEIKFKAPNWSRDGSDTAILNFVQRAQDFLFTKPHQFSVYMDEATGNFPYLATTAGTLRYEIPDTTREVYNSATEEMMDATIRIASVKEIFADNASVSDYNRYGTGNMFDSGIKRVRGERINYRFTCRPATEGTSCIVFFVTDPGTTTAKYRLDALIQPLRLTADTVPLMIPEEWEYVLVEGALGYIEYHDVGRSDRLDKFRREYAREFWSAFNIPTATIEYRGTLNKRF